MGGSSEEEGIYGGGTSIFFWLLSFSEYQLHRLRVERFHGGEFQTLHHVERALLVFLEVVGLQMILIYFFRCVYFENTDLA